MKISREWLQTHFENELPDAQQLADALTFHAFEIEGITTYEVVNGADQILDVKVTPNRGHDCLSHRGIARELSAILNMPLKGDPFRTPVSLEPRTDAVKVKVEDAALCPRFTGAYIQGIKVDSSPEWLRKRLEAVGQKSINNVVDATNYVMLDLGQPLHAFDVGKLKERNGKWKLEIRQARRGESILGLDEKEYALTDSTLVIADANAGKVVSIAGIKGGKPTGVDNATRDMFLEAANWNSVTIRKTSQALKLRTDASERFQQGMSPEVAMHGLQAAAALIVELACPEQGRGAGEGIIGFVDEYPEPQKPKQVSVSLSKVNGILGTKLGEKDVADVFTRLNLPHECSEATPHCIFQVTVPFERIDLEIAEDLVEEVGRIVGYEKIRSVELPKFPEKPDINRNFYEAEHIRKEMTAKGYSEVYTSVFTDKGKRAVANKVGGERPFLRPNLVDGLAEALKKNVLNKELLGLKEVKLFEIGTAWQNGKEEIKVAVIAEKKKGREELLKSAKVPKEYENLPLSATERYQPFSKYPYIVRDVALWVPGSTEPEEVLTLIREHAGELLVRADLFDHFEKDGRTSLAFRLVFQSFDRTLTDEDANSRMESVYSALHAKGFEIR